MKKKNIVVVYWGNDWGKTQPLQRAESTRKSFEFWHEEGSTVNINMYRASLQWYNLDKNIFTRAWAFRDNKWIKVRGPIKPDLIFDKVMSKRNYNLFELKMQIAQKVNFFNNPTFRSIIDNKLSQYLILEPFMAQSFFAINKKELVQSLRKVKTDKVVIKPIYGSGGAGIIIGDKADVLRKKITFPVLIQTFIKCSKGIPGIKGVDGVADLRMVYMNHRLVYALSRIAKKGSLFTNFHQGATAVLIEKKRIPIKIIKIAKEIVKKLSMFNHCNYSLDFIYGDDGRPYLIEMNSTPGMDLLHELGDKRLKEKHFHSLIELVK